MQTRVSTKGQVVLPGPLRRQLGIQAGDLLEASVESEIGAHRIVLTLTPKSKFKARIVVDPITGLPALTAGPGAPVLTSEMVAEMLADFP